MTSTATYTSPCTLIERQRTVPVSTNVACLGRRCPAVNLHDVHAIPISLVRELPYELTERSIGNRLREMRVSLHAPDVQVLDEHRTHLAVVREFMSDLMEPVAPDILDLGVMLRDDTTLSGIVCGTLDLFGKMSLLTPEFCFGFSHGSRTVKPTTVGANHVATVQVDADGCICVDNGIDGCQLNRRINENGHIVSAGRLAGDGHILDSAVKRAVQYDLDIPALRDRDSAPLPVDGAVLWIVKRLPLRALTLRERMRGTMLPPVDETVRALFDRVLQGLGVHIAHPWIHILQYRELRLGCNTRNAISTTNPEHRHVVERTVKHNPYTTKALLEELGLLLSRIETIFVRSQHRTNILKISNKYKENQRFMSKYNSTSHTTFNIGYHVVFCTKYRYNLLRYQAADILRRNCWPHLGKDRSEIY